MNSSVVLITGMQSAGLPWCYRIGSTGQKFPGTKATIINPDEQGNGEVKSSEIKFL